MDPSHVEQQEEIHAPEGNVPDLELLQNPSNTTHLDENPETRRVRDLTEKGKGAYTEKRNKFCEELEVLWSDITTQLLEITTPPNELQQVLTAQDNLVKACTNYRRLTDEYLDFLKRTRTLDSQKDIDACNLTLDLRLSKVELAMDSLHEHRLALTKAKSTKTKTSRGKKTSHSGSSNVSDMSSLARRKRAKAEAAKSKIAFVEKHALIIQQEAMLEEQALFRQIEMEQEAAQKKAEMEQEATRKKAEMEQEVAQGKVQLEQEAAQRTVQLEQEAMPAEAEARILEYDDSQAFSDLPDEKEDLLQRVQDFVNKLPVSTAVKEVTGPQKKKQIPVKIELSHEAPAFVPSVALNLPSQTPKVLPTRAKSPDVNAFPDLGTITNIGKQGVSEKIPVLHQNQGVIEEIPVSHPKQGVIEENPVAYQQQINPTSEITRFLLRKDLLFSRLTNFNDQAESFHTWKSSFKNVIDELQVSDSEQIDLLIKWLGPESGKHAMSIRASNANNPTRGL
ncbi:merlin-like [Mytilus edulis]|uniref:merlin-like n=1 Tax=Mytilus edulis TaxID=6550 RepID=UPI0039EE7B28